MAASRRSNRPPRSPRQGARWSRTEAEQDRIHQRVAELLRSRCRSTTPCSSRCSTTKGLQATFFELGISEAELVQAGRLPNPGFSFARLQRGDEIELERGFHFNLARLIWHADRSSASRRDASRAPGRGHDDGAHAGRRHAQGLGAAVAAEESVRYTQQVKQAAEASAELARRMDAGGQLQQAAAGPRAELLRRGRANLARAQQAAAQHARAPDSPARPVGRAGRFKLPERLPDLPKERPSARHRAHRDRAAAGRAGRHAKPPKSPPATWA